MSTNSNSKPIIHRTPPNQAGQAKVSLKKNDFDAAIWSQGYNVFIDKAIKCPCKVKSNNHALSSCKNCGGSGYVFLNRYKSKLILQSMNIDTRYKEWSEERLGTVKITARNEDELAYMDRITLLEGLTIHTETLHPFQIDNKVKARLNYPPLEIEEISAFVDSETKLKRLEYGTDYTVADNIFTFSDEFLAWEHFTVSIRYKHHPTYYIIDLPRGVMETEALNKNNGSNESTRMPIHAIGRRSHYVLDEQDFDNEFLLDNSYDITCVKKANVLIDSCSNEVLVPAKCKDVEININNTLYKNAPSGSSENILVKNTSGALVGNLINNEWIVVSPTPKVIGYLRPVNFATITYANGDDGWHKINNTDPYSFNPATMEMAIQDPSDWFKLLTLNPFGNYSRFTSKNGGYYDFNTSQWKDVNGTVTTFAAEFGPLVGSGGYIVDNLTGIGWHGSRGGQKNFNNAYLDTVNFNNNGFLGFSNRWKVPSYNEVNSIINSNLIGAVTVNNPYFNMLLNRWTSTPYMNTPTSHNMIYNRVNYRIASSRAGLGGVANFCRYHFI